MFLIEPYNSWLIKNIGANIDANTRFITKVAAVVGENKVDMTINLDLIFIYISHIYKKVQKNVQSVIFPN